MTSTRCSVSRAHQFGQLLASQVQDGAAEMRELQGIWEAGMEQLARVGGAAGAHSSPHSMPHACVVVACCLVAGQLLRRPAGLPTCCRCSAPLGPPIALCSRHERDDGFSPPQGICKGTPGRFERRQSVDKGASHQVAMHNALHELARHWQLLHRLPLLQFFCPYCRLQHERPQSETCTHNQCLRLLLGSAQGWQTDQAVGGSACRWAGNLTPRDRRQTGAGQSSHSRFLQTCDTWGV